jgi:UDPglucose 6-dehydrogenase
MDLAVVGTGYVGLVTGACFADLGNNVICVDIDEEKIRGLKRGVLPIYEPGLKEVVDNNIERERLLFTTDLAYAVKNSEIVFIAVNTPQGKNGEANLEQVEAVAKGIAEALDHNLVVVNKSTVPVGTGDRVSAILEQRKKMDAAAWVVSNPEFLREGSALRDFMFPDRIVIGGSNQNAAQQVAELYLPLGAPIIITDILSAEMIKYSSNAYLAMEISYINEIANICDRVGADVREVVRGMGLDNRINPAFLNPGVGFGGSCFPKDTYALIDIAHKAGYEFKILKSVVEVNETQFLEAINKLAEIWDGNFTGKVVAVWGLSFKPNTDDMREAPSIPVIGELLTRGARVIAYDPVAMNNAAKLLPPIEYAQNCYAAATGANALMIITEWNEFKEINLKRLAEIMEEKVIIDGRNIYDPRRVREAGFIYSGIGRK